MRIRTVLCPVDFTPLSENELSLAVAVCRRFGARLVVEHNAGGGPPSFMSVEWMWLEGHEGPDAEAMERAGERLQSILSRLPKEVAPVGKLSRGPVDAALLFVADDVQADLIVMGSHGWGGVDHHSITENIIAHAACPVLTLTDRTVDSPVFAAQDAATPPAREGTHGRVPRRRALVPVGLTRWSLKTVEVAIAVGRDLGLDLTLLHVLPASRSESRRARAAEREARRRRALESRIHQMLPSAPPEITFMSAPGSPKEAILHAAEASMFDLIVMGGHHGGIFRHLFSHPTPCEVLHGSPCPVLFVPRSMKPARVEELVTA